MKLSAESIALIMDNSNNPDVTLEIYLLLSLKNSKALAIFVEKKKIDPDVLEYAVSFLTENNLMTSEMKKTYERFIDNGNMLEREKEKKKEIREICEYAIEHLYMHSGKNGGRITKKRVSMIERLIKQGFSIDDIFMVNEYFSKKWNNPSMKKYLRPETLYNGKFPERVEEAKEYFESIEKRSKEIDFVIDVYRKSYAMVFSNYPSEKFNEINFLEKASFWLSNYPLETIANTIAITVKNWSSRPEIASKISLEKILDEKFPQRVTAAEKIVSGVKKRSDYEIVINLWGNDKKGQNVSEIATGDTIVLHEDRNRQTGTDYSYLSYERRK